MASGDLASGDFCVGEWLVQPSLGRIRRGSETVHLTPRAMEVLVHLAEAQGAVVSRNALLDAVWPRMAVTQDALSQCIVELRKAFGDDSRNPKVIETIPKIGVRLLAPVSASETRPAAESRDAATERAEPATEAEVAPAQRPAKAKMARHRWVVAGAVAAVVIGMTLGALGFLDTPGRPRSIAVLPFEYDDAADQSVRIFAEALHDELLYQLGQIRAFEKVVPHGVVMGYHDTEKTVREIGQELGVATVLEGRVHGAGDSVRLNVELIDIRTSELLWRASYTKTLTPEGFFSIQNDITVGIAEELDAALSPAALARVRDVPPHSTAGVGDVSTKSTAARGYFELGNEFFRRSSQRQRILPAATVMYDLATQEDLEFAEAWAWLGIAHTSMHFGGVDRTPGRLTHAKDAIDHAFALDSDLPEAHFAWANFLDRGMGEYEKALDAYAVAERLKPQQPNLYYLRAGAHRRRGHLDASIADLETALELDPTNVVYMRQQHVNYLFSRDYKRAEAYLDSIIEIAPDEGTAHVDKAALALYRAGDTKLANRYEDSPPTADYANALAATYTRWLAAVFDRNYPRALGILDGWTEDSISEPNLDSVPKSLLYARTHRLAGNGAKAAAEFRSAKRAIEQRLLEATQAGAAAPVRLDVALAEIHAALGETAAAENILARMGVLTDPVGRSRIGIEIELAIGVLLPLGHKQRAFDELAAYFAKPGAWSIAGLARDPRLEAIRDDPRFTALVAKYGRE